MANPALPPPLLVSQMIVSLWVPQAVHAAAELGLADALAAGPLTAEDLAAALGTHADATGRLARALVTLGLLTREQDRFALTGPGRLLQAGVTSSRRAWARLMGGRAVWEAWGRLAECVRTGRKAFGDPAEADTFDRLGGDPEGAAVFHQAMADLTAGLAPALAQAIGAGAARRVVDVGGGYGALLCAILEQHPHLEGTVFDLAHAREGALALFRRRGLAARAGFAAGSFFETPPPAADLFVLKSVIHDWDDASALAILRRCRQAMSDGQRLVLVEPAAGSPAGDPAADWFVTFSDLNMLVNTGGRERSADEYAALLGAAGLEATAVRQTGTLYAIFESVRA